MDGFAFTPQHKIHSAFKVNYVTISSLAPIHLFFLTVPAAPSRREARTERPRRGERNRGLSAVLRRAGPGPPALRARGEFRFHSRPRPPRPAPLRRTTPPRAMTSLNRAPAPPVPEPPGVVVRGAACLGGGGVVVG